MSDKSKKAGEMPLAFLLAEDARAKRNLKLLIRANNPSNEKLIDAILDELYSNTKARVERTTQLAQQAAQGGMVTAMNRKAATKDSHDEITAAARRLMASGKARRDLAGILVQQFPMTDRQIRNILKKAGI